MEVVPSEAVTERSTSTGVTRRVVSAPSRRTTTSIGSVPPARMAACTSVQAGVGVPFQEMISSPACRPAVAAGETGSGSAHSGPPVLLEASSAGTQSDTDEIVEVWVYCPTTPSASTRQTIPRTRLVRMPPAITSSLRGTLNR